MVNNMLVVITLIFSTIAVSEEKRLNKSELLEIEYNKRIKKSCIRINEINDYYVIQINDTKRGDKKVKRLIRMQMIGTRTFLFKYECHKFDLNKYKLL